LVADIEGGTYLKVFENRALRRIFGAKRDEVTRDWRLHNEEFLTNYLGDQIEKNELGGGACIAGIKETRGVYRILVGKPEGKRPLERPKRRW